MDPRSPLLQIASLVNNGTRVLIYAGDVDFICNWLGNQAWTLGLDWSGNAGFNAAPFSNWTVSGAAAGQVRNYGALSFLRVFNAGHMVPSDQPAAALAMVKNFLSNGNWYNSDL
jgi:cathepsin A (carboxypeptidase C)